MADGSDIGHNPHGHGREGIQQLAAPELPLPIALAKPGFRCGGQLYGADKLPDDSDLYEEPEKIMLLNDTGTYVVVSPLKRCHRRYKYDDSLSNNSYYVGVEGGDFRPVFIRGSGGNPDPDMGNHYRGVLFGVASTNRRGGLIIPPVDMLRPRQMTFLKTLSLNAGQGNSANTGFRRVSKEEKKQHQRQQNDDFLSGRACSVFVGDPQAELDYNVFEHMREERWEPFRMAVPKIAGREIPKRLVDEIKSFLVKYPRDIVPPTFALAMAIVWWRCHNTPECQPELGASKRRGGDGEMTRRLPSVELAELILYAPHYVRIHEEFRLSAYGHIFRFVATTYEKDVSFNEAFKINAGDINEGLVSECIAGMGLKDEDWTEIVPPSWEGSQITMPRNHGPRAPPSPELTASLMMPDVYTLGFPGYNNELKKGYGSVTRDLLMHGNWVPGHVLAGARGLPGNQKHIGTEAVEAYSNHRTPHLWTAPKTEVRPPWSDTLTTDTARKEGPRPPLENSEMSPTPAPNGHPIDTVEQLVYSHKYLVQNATRYFRELIFNLQMCKDEGLVSKEVTIGPDGHLSWPGCPRRISQTPALLPDIDIDQMIKDHAAVKANRISDRDRLILQKLLREDLAEDKHVAQCLRPLRQLIDTNDINLTKLHVTAAIESTGGPMRDAMKSIIAYGNIEWIGEDPFTSQLIKPCCVLLGLDMPATLNEAMDVIHGVERDLHAAINNVSFLVKYQSANIEPFKIAMGLITGAQCFRYHARFALFAKRLSGAALDEDDEKKWTEVFGGLYKSKDGGGN